MADEREEEVQLDEKEVKKAQKERAKEEKRLKKEAKAKEKEAKEAMEEEEESTGGKVVVFFVSLLIVAIWLAIFALLIKWDVGGFGSSVLYPIFKDVPYVNKILPEVNDPAKDDPYAFESMDDAINRIKELELLLAEEKNNTGDVDGRIEELQNEIARLKVYEQQQVEFEEIRTKFYQEVVFGDEAPDINEYKTFYEAINPQNAEQIYKQVVSQVQKDEEIADYVKAYSEMKPKAAAQIMEKMTDDLELVAKILQNMKADARGDILAAMDATVAADVTKLMEP